MPLQRAKGYIQIQHWALYVRLSLQFQNRFFFFILFLFAYQGWIQMRGGWGWLTMLMSGRTMQRKFNLFFFYTVNRLKVETETTSELCLLCHVSCALNKSNTFIVKNTYGASPEPDNKLMIYQNITKQRKRISGIFQYFENLS